LLIANDKLFEEVPDWLELKRIIKFQINTFFILLNCPVFGEAYTGNGFALVMKTPLSIEKVIKEIQNNFKN
jgi:hypothetical protein